MSEVYGPHEVFWGILIATYPFFSGIVTGAYVTSILAHVFGKEKYRPIAKLALIVSTSFLLVVAIPLVAELGQPSRALEIFTRTHTTSPMGVFGWLLVSFIALSLIQGWFMFREGIVRKAEKDSGVYYKSIQSKFYRLLALGNEDLSDDSLKRDASAVKILGAIGIPLATLFPGYVGFLFGSVKARSLWNTPLLPVMFVLSALISGIALLIIVDTIMEKYFSAERKVNRELIYGLGGLLAWFIILDLGFTGLEIAARAYAGEEEWFAASFLLTGELSWSYLGVEIVLGLIIPLILLAIPAVKRSMAGEIVASLLALIGVYAMRYNVIIGGQLIPRTGQTILTYTPSLTHVGTLIGTAALALFFYMIGVWILPWEQSASGKEEVV
ncbi:MAG: NrfD/PsrC family molybdoenzyme membrane anchor subunit [Candidatus Bathyarchaeia archaeon]